MSVPYPIGAVSRLTGISTDTLRAWERRYQAVTPPRGGRRRDYDQADVERLTLLRRVVEKGHAIGSVARLPNAELREMLTEQTGPDSDSSIVNTLLSLLDRFDYAALNERLSRIAALLPASEVVEQVVFPVMREVGERWHRKEISMAQEHMMTMLVQRILGTLLTLNRPAADAPKLIFTTPQGEEHSLAVLAAAMLAPGAGISPIYLGPNLPVDEILLAQRRSGARAIVLQITDAAVRSEPQVREIEEKLPADVEVWLGGNINFEPGKALVFEHFSELETEYRRIAATA
jgi:DNA-binding transcriptional MerR regulator